MSLLACPMTEWITHGSGFLRKCYMDTGNHSTLIRLTTIESLPYAREELDTAASMLLHDKSPAGLHILPQQRRCLGRGNGLNPRHGKRQSAIEALFSVCARQQDLGALLSAQKDGMARFTKPCEACNNFPEFRIFPSRSKFWGNP